MKTLESLWVYLQQSNTVRLAVAQVVGSAIAVLGGELTWRQGGAVAAIGILQIVQRAWKLQKNESEVSQ